MKGRELLEGLGINDSMWTGFICSGQGLVMGLHEHINILAGSIKDTSFLSNWTTTNIPERLCLLEIVTIRTLRYQEFKWYR
jgi:hypothetical protein